jgi:heme-degrading monooxygenase HmoA
MSKKQSRRALMRVAGSAAAGAIYARGENREGGGAVEQLPFAVCFEVEPTAEGFDQYLETAKILLPELERVTGFVSIERSRDMANERRLLSLSYWADEAALAAWRAHGGHHEAQLLGRNHLFADYRLRVVQVVRQWTPRGVRTAERRSAYNQPPFHERRYLAIVQTEMIERTAKRPLEELDRKLEWQSYQSMAHSGIFFFLAALPDQESGMRLEAGLMSGKPGEVRQLQICEIERDYGRFHREQAPQHFPAVSERREPEGN